MSLHNEVADRTPVLDATSEPAVVALICRLKDCPDGAEILTDELRQVIGAEINHQLGGKYIATISQSGHLLLFEVSTHAWGKLAPYLERGRPGAMWCSKKRFSAIQNLVSRIHKKAA